MAVAQTIACGLEMQDTPRTKAKHSADERLTLVRMTKMVDRKTSEISGGQQQRVALACALVHGPRFFAGRTAGRLTSSCARTELEPKRPCLAVHVIRHLA
jgi:ABC-type ATPase involved in cell division